MITLLERLDRRADERLLILTADLLRHHLDAGDTPDDIARATGASTNTIRRHLAELLPMDGPALAEARYDRFRALGQVTELPTS